jgi:hypothetical protein
MIDLHTPQVQHSASGPRLRSGFGSKTGTRVATAWLQQQGCPSRIIAARTGHRRGARLGQAREPGKPGERGACRWGNRRGGEGSVPRVPGGSDNLPSANLHLNEVRLVVPVGIPFTHLKFSLPQIASPDAGGADSAGIGCLRPAMNARLGGAPSGRRAAPLQMRAPWKDRQAPVGVRKELVRSQEARERYCSCCELFRPIYFLTTGFIRVIWK